MFRDKGHQLTKSMRKAITFFREGRTPKGAIYHGVCVTCLWLKDNDTHAGVEYCKGCRYSNCNWDLPDKSDQVVKGE